jgi:hypothetical protein
MTDCVFCNIIAIKCKETEAYLVNQSSSDGSPDHSLNHYAKITIIAKPTINASELINLKSLTPGARLILKSQDVQLLLQHKSVWELFLKSDKHHAVVFNSIDTAIDNIMQKKLESKTLAKDWDICLISDTEYIFTKRAARILYGSSKQFNTDLKTYLLSFSVLAVNNLD